MKTKLNKLDIDWINVKNKARTTVNKDYSDKEVTEEFKKKSLLSEHSIIRLLKIDFSWHGIKSWCATHFSRSKWECFISTQRSDRTGVNRGDLSQDELVNFDGEMNAQHAIDTSRKRLCYQSSGETRQLMEDFKITLHNNEETKEIADVLVPNCIYRNGCPEFNKCGYFEKLYKNATKEEMIDINKRYEIYNEQFYKERKNESELGE